jgi:hypothetical protein
MQKHETTDGEARVFHGKSQLVVELRRAKTIIEGISVKGKQGPEQFATLGRVAHHPAGGAKKESNMRITPPILDL